MPNEVSAEEWNLAPEMPNERCDSLLNPPSAGQLIEALFEAARQAADTGKFSTWWEPANTREGQARISGTFRCPKVVFDQFFNGRTGYRAQYYLGCVEGERYNRQVLDRLEPVVVRACASAPTRTVPAGAVRASLRAKGAKVWFRERRDHHRGRSLILPKNWEAYWKARPGECSKGLTAAPRSLPLLVEVKGGWVHDLNGYPPAPEMKARHKLLHKSGWPA